MSAIKRYLWKETIGSVTRYLTIIDGHSIAKVRTPDEAYVYELDSP